MAQWKDQKDDDFFGSLDDEDDFIDVDDHNVAEDDITAEGGRRRCPEPKHEWDSGLGFAETKALETRFRNLGYHEGFEETKEQRLQDGFEDGYREHFDVLLRIGKLLGRSAFQQTQVRRCKQEQTTTTHEQQPSSKNDDNGNSMPMAAASLPPHVLLAAQTIRDRLTLQPDGNVNDLTRGFDDLEEEVKGLLS